MPYATKDDIAALYSEDLVDLLGDTDGDGSADDAKMTAALTAAHGIIDAYLTQRYVLPITNPPEILKQLCIDITVYRLALGPASRTEEMRQRYEDAISFLKQLADGKAALPIPTTGDGEGEGGTPTVPLQASTQILWTVYR